MVGTCSESFISEIPQTLRNYFTGRITSVSYHSSNDIDGEEQNAEVGAEPGGEEWCIVRTLQNKINSDKVKRHASRAHNRIKEPPIYKRI